MLYIASAGPGLPIKIGDSINPQRRMGALRCPLTGKRPNLIAVGHAGDRREWLVLDAMVERCVGGEWFDGRPGTLFLALSLIRQPREMLIEANAVDRRTHAHSALTGGIFDKSSMWWVVRRWPHLQPIARWRVLHGAQWVTDPRAAVEREKHRQRRRAFLLPTGSSHA